MEDDMEQKKIGEIKAEVRATADENLGAFLEAYASDERSGVRALVTQAQKRMEKLEKELERIENLKIYERKYSDCSYICGIDEVGRGPLVGPVVAAAVILPRGYKLEGLTDSKKLSEKKRDEFYKIIMKDAVAVGVGVVSAKVIDEVNIYEATKIAMKEAISKLAVKPEHVLIDAMPLDLVIPTTSIIKGDLKSITISAASVIAKVTRDKML